VFIWDYSNRFTVLFHCKCATGEYLNQLILLSNSETENDRYASMIQDYNDILSVFDNGPAYTTLRIEFTMNIDRESVATVKVLDDDDDDKCHGAISMDMIVKTLKRLHSAKGTIVKKLRRPLEIVGKDEEEGEGEICVICQKEYKADEIVRRLKCRHGYHEECIEEWLLHKNDCPICRDGTVPWLKL